MKNLFLIFICLLFLSNSTIVEIKLAVEIENLRNDAGNVLLELVDAEKNKIGGEIGQIINGKSLIVFENLEPKKYAIRYIHDENSNGKLDLNFLGLPKEGYGISNNAYGLFGPKDFEKRIFSVTGSTKISLRTTY